LPRRAATTTAVNLHGLTHGSRAYVRTYSNNAGKYADRFAVSEDGVEMTFATNYLGHFLLTRLLLDKMADTARATGVQGRIVNVSSTIHSWFPGDGDALGYLDRVTRRKMCVC
jgi:retinol dehydrogenase 12